MDTVDMNSEQQAAARSLAVAYDAYNRAIKAEPADNGGIIVWGEALRIAQQETGIELHGDTIIYMVTRARQRQQDERVAQLTAESCRMQGKKAAARHAERTARKAAAKIVSGIVDARESMTDAEFVAAWDAAYNNAVAASRR